MANLHRGKKLTDGERDRCRQLIKQGLSDGVITQRMRISTSAVKRLRAELQSEKEQAGS